MGTLVHWRVDWRRLGWSSAGIAACLIVGLAIGSAKLPPFWVTLLFGAAAFLFVLIRPFEGLLLILAALYFPLLPNINLGPLDGSPTSILAIGIFLGALNQQRRHASLRLARWQTFLLAAMAVSFMLSLVFSDAPGDSLRMLPNLAVYCLLLYGIMVLVRSEEQLWLLARWIIVLGFLLSIWRVELRPLRWLLGLPSLGINGAVFNYHPAVALTLVIAVFLPQERTGRSWRLFSWLAFLSLVYHGLLYQTRAGWLAWAVMLPLLGWQARGRARLAFILSIVVVSLIGILAFATELNQNWEQTLVTIEAAIGETSYEQANSSDVIRLVARDAGLRMFHARPIFGWGPGAYLRLKPGFVTYVGKEADLPGAFNSWLIALAEWGAVGTAAALAIFMLPMGLAWWALLKKRQFVSMLALGFAVGVLGLSIHLLFIDLFYSFAWAHAGLALAAARLAIETPLETS